MLKVGYNSKGNAYNVKRITTMSNVKGQMSNVALIPTDKRMIKNSKPIAHSTRLFQLEYKNTRTLKHTKRAGERLNVKS